MESFAGVANPFSLRDLKVGDRVIDLGSGAGFDCFLAAGNVGPTGHVIGIDMTEEMLTKSRAAAKAMSLENVDFREGILEKLPVEDGWADVVISNGVINLCADKQQVFGEIQRVLKPGGHCSSQTSPTAIRFPRLPWPTSIFGRPELPVVCRVQPGKR